MKLENYAAIHDCRMGRFPPVVRTAVPVDGRFEHIVLSCNATSDHAILWIERECQWAFDVSSCLSLPLDKCKETTSTCLRPSDR